MKKIVFILILLIIIGIGVGIAYNRQTSQSSSDKKKVAATIFPLYDIARNVAGTEIDVMLVLPPGASPHSYEPSPEGIRRLQGSDALFYIGHGIDDWSTSMANSADIKYQIAVDKNVSLLKTTEKNNQEYKKSDNEINPHYWLSIKNAEQMATQIKDDLISLYPENKDVFTHNYDNYIQELQTAEKEFSATIQVLPNKNIATFHNAYGYFADEYGLTVVTTFEEFPGEEPSPDYLHTFTNNIKEHNVKVIFAEPQFSTRSLEPIADDLGVTISQLDPIGGVPGRESFIALMNYNVNQVTKAVSQ